MEEEQRSCAHCGEPFKVNRRARGTHLFCARAGCQRERKRRAQQGRRAGSGVPPPSAAGKERRAEYMREYRQRRPEYRERERLGRAARRARAKPAVEAVTGDAAELRAVTEAELTEWPAVVYLARGPQGQVRLRLVAEAGKSVMLCLAGGWDAEPGAVTEAG